MALNYPLTLPASPTFSRMVFHANSAVGLSASPFTFAQQVYENQGEMWEADVELPPMQRADAEAWIGFLLGLNGRRGTFFMGDPVGTSPRGTWGGGSPVVNGNQSAGVKTVSIRGVDGLTWKAGDWFQLGSGSATRLHRIVQDGSQVGSPQVGDLEIWPRTRAALSDGQALTLSSAKGIWRLSDNKRSWSMEIAQVYGIAFSAMEAL